MEHVTCSHEHAGKDFFPFASPFPLTSLFSSQQIPYTLLICISYGGNPDTYNIKTDFEKRPVISKMQICAYVSQRTTADY